MARMKAIGLLAALVLTGCATVERGPAQDRIGRIYSYVRSDRDGAEAETILVFRRDRTHIEVSKMRARCTNAAYVTGTLDIGAGYATRLGAGRLLPGAGREEFGVLTYDPATRRIDARLTTPNGPVEAHVVVPDAPWHLFASTLRASP